MVSLSPCDRRRGAQTCSPNSATAAVTQNVNGYIHPPNIPNPHSILQVGTTCSAAFPASAGVHDLQEEEIFSMDSHFSEPNHRSPNPLSSFANPKQNPSPGHSLSRFGSRRFNKRNLGILAALPEEVNNYSLLHRNLSSYFSICSSSARVIPAISKPKLDCVLSFKGGKMYHQSAPMNVPVMPLMPSKESAVLDWDVRGHADVVEEDILPPHEIVARVSSMESPMISFSMLEGFGRTLKGRDLRRVRNAVWRQTGFQD